MAPPLLKHSLTGPSFAAQLGRAKPFADRRPPGSVRPLVEDAPTASRPAWSHRPSNGVGNHPASKTCINLGQGPVDGILVLHIEYK